jgi:hypothetical protein
MKNLLLLGAMSLVGLGAAQAQTKDFYKTSYKSRNSGSFSKNTGILSFGLGFPNLINNSYNNFGGFGPVYAKYEHGIMDEISIGGYLAAGFGNYRYGWNSYKVNVFGFSGAVLGYYHFNKLIPVSKLDVYAGIGFGFRSLAYKTDNGNFEPDNDFDPLFIAKVGARWYFTQSFAVYAESGYDKMSSVNLGVSLRF